jgi:hypothetical protein
MKGDIHYKILDLHRQYGNVVRVQPNHISFINVEAIEDVHGFKATPVKGDTYDNLMKPPVPGARHTILSTPFLFFVLSLIPGIVSTTIIFDAFLEQP